MDATVLVDNIAAEDLVGEWGLSIFIENEGKKILLDVGASYLFYQNALKLDCSIKDVDYAVLSHAHFDHANGMREFFDRNEKADFYLQEQAKENCYEKFWIFPMYIGIPRKVLSQHKKRIKYVNGKYEITDNIFLLAHSTPDLEDVGKRNKMMVKHKNKLEFDNFAHEQSLIIKKEEGLVVFNSCSHGGVINIVKEVKEAFPEQNILAYIGGFHIYNWKKEQVVQLAKEIKELGVQKIYTGHCTGKKAFATLKEELAEQVVQLKVGLKIHI